ncbi:MAG TPA: hypothetical protein VGK73_21150 [Polyangiaceae bacterium]
MKRKSVRRTLSVSGSSGRSWWLAALSAGALSLATLPACSSDEADDDGGMGGAGSGGASAGKGGAPKGGSAGSTAGSAGKGSANAGTAGSSSAGTAGRGGASGSGSGGTSGGSGGAGSSSGPPGGAAGTSAGSGAAGGAGGTGASAGDAGDGPGGQDNAGGAGASGGSDAGGSGATGGTSGSSGEGTLDPFGIREIYPTAPGGAEWTSEHWGEGDDYEISGRSDPNDPSGLSGMRGDGELQVTGDGELVMSGSQPRIYIYEPDSGPWRDVEVTAYYQRVEDSDTAYAGLVMGVRSGEDGHTDSNACDAHTYYARVRNDGAFDFEKELEHPASSTQSRVQPDDAWPDGEVPRDTWIGFKFVIYNLGNTGNVKFEAYRDMTNGEDGGDWELVNETVDDGGWFVDTGCSEHDPSGGESDMIVTEGGTTFIRNTDVQEARYRWVSVREIEAP